MAPQSGAGTPTGSVDFSDGTTKLGSGTLAVVNGQDQASFSTVTLAAGSHTITASYGGDSGFSGSTSTLTQQVGKATLTVTADNKTTAYGAALPTLTYTPSGFVNGDTASVLTGSPSLSTTATSTSDPETYPISIGQGTLAAANYTFTFVNGTLTVVKADQSITFGTPPGTPSYTYLTDAAFTVGATASSGLGVGFAAGPAGVCTVSGTAVSIVGGGTCTVTASQAGNADYNKAADVSRSFTVNPAGQTITFPALADTTYGAAPVALAAAASSGLAVSYTAAGPCAVSGATLTIAGAGTCTATAHQAGNGSFSAAPDVARSFAIAKAPLKITADSKAVPFGAPIPTLTYTPSGFVHGDTASALSGAPALSTTATAGSAPGQYPITAGQGSLSAANYTFTFAGATLTITKAQTTTSLLASPSPATFGQPVTLTATIAPVAPGAGAPSGIVTFLADGVALGTGTLGGQSPDQAILTVRALQVGTHQLTAAYAGDADFQGSATSGPVAETVGCTRTVTGTVPGALVVTGATCVVNAQVGGAVLVRPGAALSMVDSSAASIQATGATALAVCGSTLGGALAVQGSAGYVLVGDGGDDAGPACAGNTVQGGVTLDGNRGGLELGGNRVDGGARVTNNAGARPGAEDAAPEIEGNQFGAGLSCSGNTPAPTDDGKPNAVAGGRSGQCAAPGF